MNIITQQNLDAMAERITTNTEAISKAIDVLKSENAKLKAFARLMIEEMFDGHDVEGFDIQDMAERNGLIVPRVATEDDVEAGIECEVGDTIYQFADWMAE